jgi:arginine utilization regulatory protein
MDADPVLSAAVRLFSEFFDETGLSIAIIDTEMRYVFYNTECARLDGCLREHALGKRMQDINPHLDMETSTMRAALLQQKRFIDQYQLYVNAAGKPIAYQFTTLPLVAPDGRTVGVIELGRDLSLLHSQHAQILDLLDRMSGGSIRPPTTIIAESAAMKQVLAQADRLARIDIPVLIYGETGTGKELLARRLHAHSLRADKPLLVLNCAAIPENLLESTLFGTVRGAFTGAEDRGGMLEAAQGGSLLLDELNSLPLLLQAKLLRVLQEHRFCRVGSSREIEADVRFIAATNEDPQSLLERRMIRADLLYRLNVGYLHIPPLRERRQDVRPLAVYFLGKHRDLTDGRVSAIDETLLARMERHGWPGNVRMLENVIVQGLVLCEQGDVLRHVALSGDMPRVPLPAVFPPRGALPGSDATEVLHDVDRGQPVSVEAAVEAFERRLLVECLHKHPNLSEAARYCGLPRTTLQYKMKKHAIHMTVQVED